jgi:hypothetical protein
MNYGEACTMDRFYIKRQYTLERPLSYLHVIYTQQGGLCGNAEFWVKQLQSTACTVEILSVYNIVVQGRWHAIKFGDHCMSR